MEKKMLFDGGGSGLIISAELLLVNDVLLLANLSVADTPSCNLTVGIMIRMFEPLSQDDYLFPIFTYEFNGTVTTSGITAVSVHAPKPGDAQYNITQNSSTTIYWRDPASSCPNLDRLAGLVALDFSIFNNSWDTDLSNIGSSLGLYACKGQYNWATARVTVDANTQAPISIDQLANQTTFSNKEFNVSVFESFLEIGRIQPEDILTANASDPGLWAITHTQSLGDVVVSNLAS